MSPRIPNFGLIILISCLLFLIYASPVDAFGAGNIPSISSIEGINFRHGDIEDMLKTVACIKGHKWTSMMIKRVYFGNWLRDYSQAVDVGSLKGIPLETIRILVWVLSFLSFGFATKEFEVTNERLGVYRPEEHIDNPKDYADNKDARQYDQRLRGPVHDAELAIDLRTGMKNYIANENYEWATSSGYVRFSFLRSIHFGRIYTSGAGDSRGKNADLCEALRCLGQGLHCLEDFGAHTNYVELALRELGFQGVFPHTGCSSEINIRGRYIFPLVTGTFGAVDFLHSVLGEATDHFSQTEVDEMDIVLKNAESSSQASGMRSNLLGSGGELINLLKRIPVTGNSLSSTARKLESDCRAQSQQNSMRDNTPTSPKFNIPGTLSDFDTAETVKKIYPILEFRDNVVRAIQKTIAKIPGLESLVEKISETLTLFILSLLSPYIRPIINAASKALKQGSTTVLEASARAQFEPWNDPNCTDPTHSMLSKDHFSNILNNVAGKVATTILQYVTPRIIYAWENPGVNVDEVMSDILCVFHHPGLRDDSLELHQNMFNTVRIWVEEQPDKHKLNEILSSESVKAGRNHVLNDGTKGFGCDHRDFGGHGKNSNSIWSEIRRRNLADMKGDNELYPSPVRSPSDTAQEHRISPNYHSANSNYYNSYNSQFQSETPGGYWEHTPMESNQLLQQGPYVPHSSQQNSPPPYEFPANYPGIQNEYPGNSGYKYHRG